MYRFKLNFHELKILEELGQILQIKLRKKALYIVALTHKSYYNTLKRLKRKIYSYEKLEFLGDAVLQFIVTDILYKKFPKQEEGALSSLRSYLVRESTLAKVVRELNISKFIQTGKSFRIKVHSSEHVLSDVYESLVAAIYLDRGIRTAKNFIERTLVSRYNLPEILEKKEYLDPKTQLQEIVQKSFGITPVYKTSVVKDNNGLEKYVSYVTIKNSVVAQAMGTTKAEAEFSAAEKTLKNLNKIIKKLNAENQTNKNGEKA